MIYQVKIEHKLKHLSSMFTHAYFNQRVYWLLFSSVLVLILTAVLNYSLNQNLNYVKKNKPLPLETKGMIVIVG